MHYVCTTFGSSGDVFPVLGLAVELQRRGHDVTFQVNEYFRDAVERAGVRFEQLGTAEQFLASIRHPDLWSSLKAFPHVIRTLKPGLREQYDLLARLHRPGETVAVTNALSFGALNAQDKLGLPVVMLHLQPAVLWSDVAPPALPGLFGPRWLKSLIYSLGERFVIDPVVCPVVNPWRRELGLPPVRRVTRWWHSPYLNLGLFPGWFCPPAPDWPAGTVLTDFPLWDDPADGVPPAVEAFLNAGDPPVVFTPGSANVHGAAFFRAAAEACGRLRRRGLLVTRFAEQIPAGLPDGVSHFPFVPFTALLPRAAAVVHHGGIGTASQGMAAGVPQLIMPLAHDQFDNAERLKRLNLGDSLAPARFTGPRVADKLGPLLSSPAVAEACALARRRLASRDGLHRTADAVESRARGQ
ncbi:MAG: glycosyltransferase [Gemmataceae bacterium]